MADARKGFAPGDRMVERPLDVDLHDLPAGVPQHGAQHGQLKFLAAAERMKREIDLPVEVHLSLAEQADGVAGERHVIDQDVFPLNAKIDVALGESRAVGNVQAEDF